MAVNSQAVVLPLHHFRKNQGQLGPSFLGGSTRSFRSTISAPIGALCFHFHELDDNVISSGAYGDFMK